MVQHARKYQYSLQSDKISYVSITSGAIKCSFSKCGMQSFVHAIMFFSDANLERDDFLKSLMDEHGWVPVSKLADFNRVCFLSRLLNIKFLLFCPCARKQLIFLFAA